MNAGKEGRKVRVGFVGCGEVAHKYAYTLKKIREAYIKAVADINVEKAKNFAMKFKVKRYYSSLSDMLASEELDAVLILTNPQTHCKLAVEAMNAGKHVLIEKPLCVTAKEAEKIVEASKRNNVILFPVEQFLFTPAIQKSIELISSGKMGEVTSIYAYASISPLVRGLKRNELPKWFYTLPGGIYGEEISHPLYTTLKILNEPIEKVYASCVGRSGENVLPCSELRILLEGENKSARIVMTTRSESRHTLLNLVINCEKCTIIVDPPLSLSLIRNYSSSRFTQALSFTKNFVGNVFRNIHGFVSSKIYEGCSWEAVSRAFITSIVENCKPPITGEEAVELVRITELIWEQAFKV
jgi:predicted dehydrogenase